MRVPDAPSPSLAAVRPFARIAPLTDADAGRGLLYAIALGIDITVHDETIERRRSTLSLLCASLGHLVNLTVASEYVALEKPPPPVLRIVRQTTAGAVRLVWQALQTHAAEVGYAAGPWRDAAAREASLVVAHGADEQTAGSAELGDVPRLALRHVTTAIEVCGSDRMAVPGELASALGLLTPVYLLATEMLG